MIEMFASETWANANATSDRIACVYVMGTEGVEPEEGEG